MLCAIAVGFCPEIVAAVPFPTTNNRRTGISLDRHFTTVVIYNKSRRAYRTNQYTT